MNGFGGAGVNAASDPWSSSGVQLAANHENYVPGVHHPGNGAPAQGAVHQNGVSNGLMNGFEDEQARLRADIAVAKERTVAARRRIAEHDAAGRAALRTELEATRERLAEMERVHREAVAVVRDNVQLEVERILAEAHQRAAAIHHGDADVERSNTTDVE